MKHLLFDVFKKPDGKFAVQMPRGIFTFNTKKEAKNLAEKCIDIDPAVRLLSLTSSKAYKRGEQWAINEAVSLRDKIAVRKVVP